MSKQTVDVVVVAWPVSPARLSYCKIAIESLRVNLRAKKHRLQFMVSIGQERDPHRTWCGDELVEYLKNYGTRYEWRQRKRESLGYAMNEAVAMSSSPYMLLVQDDAMLLRQLDLSASINLMEEVPKIDVIRFGWSLRRGFVPSTKMTRRRGWRSVDRKKAWCFSDNAHLRRSSFVERFGQYDETPKHGVSEHKMIQKVQHSKCLILMPDTPPFFHSGGGEPAGFREAFQKRIIQRSNGGAQ